MSAHEHSLAVLSEKPKAGIFGLVVRAAPIFIVKELRIKQFKVEFLINTWPPHGAGFNVTE